MEEPDPWELVHAALDRAVQAARDHPADAQDLYNLRVLSCRTPESLERLRADFIDLGIPTDTLSFNQVPAPFP